MAMQLDRLTHKHQIETCCLVSTSSRKNSLSNQQNVSAATIFCLFKLSELVNLFDFFSEKLLTIGIVSVAFLLFQKHLEIRRPIR